MINTIIFDIDGVVLHREMYFSERFSKEFKIPIEKILPFFKNEFQLCLIGKADLKNELNKYTKQWDWQRSVDELIHFWFENENKIDQEILEIVKSLKDKGIKCYLSTDNEKYRVEYILNNLNLKKYFDGIFSSSEFGFSKSQQEFWSEIYKKLNILDKKEILVLDDDIININSANLFGFNSKLYFNKKECKEYIKFLV